ncbi:calcium/proton exchanger [Verruconis gallopava]|uniref:Calcium/proton exchanger n=1 Tax=Verruconis gallopava TaxID=253628 RepID=A0A0D1Z6G4_9PEZI|nr:calcium/proton exchanger [Verruconis gallopava]KIW08522.1 calcium/proton exchanger [Verruconis gallopava]
MSSETSPTRRNSEISRHEQSSGGPPDVSTPSQSQSSSAHFGSASQMSDTPRRRPPVLGSQAQVEGYGTINTNPRSSRTSQRPKPSRRSTSTHVPHKGQEFSVDDDEDEVDEELERKREQEREERKAARIQSLRRQASTVRRRPAAQAPNLAKVDSEGDEDGEGDRAAPAAASAASASAPTLASGSAPPAAGDLPVSSGEEVTLQGEESADILDDCVEDEEDDEGAVSEAESFTLKDRQDAINVTHPFGIRIWKPALYKKGRSVQRNAEADIHSTPGGNVNAWLFVFNYLWTVCFGWWLGLLCLAGALLCVLVSLVSESCMAYAVVLWGLGRYLIYPFGKFVTLVQDEAYAEEDEGEGRSISEYEQWQSGDLEEGRLFFGPVQVSRSLIGRRRTSVESASETQSLLGRHGRNASTVAGGSRTKRRMFGRGKWNFGRIVFYMYFYGLITPALMLVSCICWFLVFSIPMGKVTLLLFDHLRRHPLALSFHAAGKDVRHPDGPPSSVLVCTYRAAGLKYWKYTIDGTNIMLINLLAIVVFTIFDFYVLNEALGLRSPITGDAFIFVTALASIMPLAYFIGQAVASISAQSSMGLGAAVNAFFSTVVEVFLYCVALKDGKHQLVEGSIIGSIFAAILLLPGLSMCFGALKRKTQRFNVKSAGVTSTMLLFAMIGAFSPTLFYQIYGSHELKCSDCDPDDRRSEDRDCRRCFFAQVPAVHDSFYQDAVLPYIYFSAVTLFLSYIIGLLFTLRTHAAVIWNTEVDEKKGASMETSHTSASAAHPHPASEGLDRLGLTRQTTAGSLDRDVRNSALYQRILGQSLRHAGVSSPTADIPGTVKMSRPGPPSADGEPTGVKSPHIVPPKSRDGEAPPAFHLHGLSDADNRALIREVAELAATAATVAARDAQTRQPHHHRTGTAGRQHRSAHEQSAQDARIHEMGGAPEIGGHAASGGHDAPNWGRSKSVIILLVATLAYAIIAEILVDTVDSVLDNVDIDEKFLGITLFALVPNTTEFLNAISFAMNGNIALSMEIGSAYALQVCLLQIPALVAYSAIWGRFINPEDVIDHTFTLIFPQWDMVTVILCIFLLSYMYGEGKSNYFKGSILILSYLVVVLGFYFSSYENGGVDAMDTLALGISPLSPAWRSVKQHGFEMRGREL